MNVHELDLERTGVMKKNNWRVKKKKKPVVATEKKDQLFSTCP